MLHSDPPGAQPGHLPGGGTQEPWSIYKEIFHNENKTVPIAFFLSFARHAAVAPAVGRKCAGTKEHTESGWDKIVLPAKTTKTIFGVFGAL